jgi:SAM-dependent methyltransferase
MNFKDKFVRSAMQFMFLLSVGKLSMANVFDELFDGTSKSPTLKRIFKEAYGKEYAEDVDQNSFVSLSMLELITGHLYVGQGQVFMDLACGSGGPGLWIARKAGAGLTGVDISKVAIEHAKNKAAEFGLEQEINYVVGGFGSTGLPDNSHNGAICIDSLFMANDLSATLIDIARILKPNSRFAFTTWEGGSVPPHNIKDYSPFLQEAGFEVEIYKESEDWKKPQRAAHEGILREKEALMKEMGKTAAKIWISGAKMTLKQLDHLRRTLVVAKKK